jgi:hypothetical protein
MQISKRLPAKDAKSSVDSPTIAGPLILGVVLVSALWAMTREWDKPLLDLHAFRQTQTAISAYYVAEDSGMFFDYITPVLGKPWSIPMELPIYQWIVARWHNLSGMGLDQSGKAISIALWFACILPVWRLLDALGQTTIQRCLALIVIYSSPLYLYWGRSFMIESTGLFLSLGMVACVLHGYAQRSWRWLLAGLAFGSLAALCKITTWAVSVGVAQLLIVFFAGRLPKRSDFTWLGAASVALILPIIPAKFWLAYGDTLKAQNIFAKDLILSTSANQRSWNFGTLEQKLDPATWRHIGQHIADQLLVPNAWAGGLLAGLVLIIGAACIPRRIPVIAIFIAGFAAGPLVFTNLYFEHNYYWFANSIWLLLAIGTALGGIEERLPGRWPKLAPQAIALVMAGCGLLAWKTRFLPILQKLPSHEQLAEAWTKPIQRIVPVGKTLMIIGQDWNPTALYYAGRRGIMLPSKSTDPFYDLQKSISLLDPSEAIGAVCIAPTMLTAENQESFARALAVWGMSLQSQPSPFGMLFPLVKNGIEATNTNQ